MHRPHFPVAVLGHEGHGKTALCQALVAGARLKGGRTDVRTGRFETPTRRFTLLDVPGGGRSVRSALRACSLADAALLVVSSTDGPMLQTRDHVMAARAVGLPLVVAINDFDGDALLLEACDHEVRSVLVDHGVDGDDCAVVRVKIVEGQQVVSGADAVIAALEALATPRHDDEAPALVRVLFRHERLTHALRSGTLVEGEGAVASGRVLAGTLKPGQRIRVLGGAHAAPLNIVDDAERRARVKRADATAVVDRVEIEGAAVNAARAGEHVGVQLRFDQRLPPPGQTTTTPSNVPGAAPVRSIPRYVNRQAAVLVAGDAIKGPAVVVTARLELRAASIGGREHPLLPGFECLAWLGCASAACNVTPLDEEQRRTLALPGATFRAAIALWRPRYAAPGLPIVLTGDGGVIAWGKVEAVAGGEEADASFFSFSPRTAHRQRTSARARRALAGAAE